MLKGTWLIKYYANEHFILMAEYYSEHFSRWPTQGEHFSKWPTHGESFSKWLTVM
jgi:hypothetical protein